MKRLVFISFFVLVAASGCVTADPAKVMEANFRMLAAQVQAASVSTHPKLHYQGMGLFSEQWSENDVVKIGDRLSAAKGYAYAPIILSNRFSSVPQNLPGGNAGGDENGRLAYRRGLPGR